MIENRPTCTINYVNFKKRFLKLNNWEVGNSDMFPIGLILQFCKL